MKIEPIGYIRTPFKEKFGIPRQALSNINGQCKLEMTGAYSHPSFYKGLESFSHLWIHYYLDKAVWKGQTTLRPPRLGGEKKMGLFATRGPHRPNPIGQSLVQLNKIEFNTQSTVLHTSLIDAIDNTPVLDIKPYISNYDMASEAKSGWVNETSFPSLKIDFSNNVILSLKRRFPN
ncbi:MAG: tRNA (N6-threonylcarbamoyladenosine(37)-N6)-methyltransferase TrmO, partial [Bacteriovoracaceae bacterium]